MRSVVHISSDARWVPSSKEREQLILLSVALGLLHANLVEWLVHKYVLHGLGKQKGSMFRFHWAQHHRISRRNGMYDKSYFAPFWSWKDRGKEILGILFLAALHIPLFRVAPYFTAAVWFSSFNYLYRHRKAHVDVEWGKKHMPHHWDHHMGPNQDSNWCVSYPWFDWILGTRERSVEPKPKAKRAARRASRLARASSPGA
jgi:sterol desaturase/sphingolipid hydroxylase (fatty acid hydroxylase superfamily)